MAGRRQGDGMGHLRAGRQGESSAGRQPEQLLQPVAADLLDHPLGGAAGVDGGILIPGRGQPIGRQRRRQRAADDPCKETAAGTPGEAAGRIRDQVIDDLGGRHALLGQLARQPAAQLRQRRRGSDRCVGQGGFSLTPAGEAYFGAVSGALNLIAQATLQARAPSLPIITLSCTPGFAQQWLLPRLARLEAVAKLDLRIRATNAVCDFARDRVDFAVRHGRGPYPGLATHPLFDDDLVVVAAPGVRRPGRRKPEARDVEGHQLLHDEHRGDWRLWLEAAGLPPDLAQRGPVFENSNAAIEAAAAGGGLALAPLPLVQPMLERRQLVRWWSGSLKAKLAYRLVHPAWVLRRPEALVFRDWLLGEAGAMLPQT
jgi:LysR family transcriptional regulator, glycine cleavage system transcriptional activator